MNYEPSIDSIEQKFHNGDYSDYTLHFEPVLNTKGSVRFIDHSQGKELTVGINVDDNPLLSLWQNKNKSQIFNCR
jgi:hypothetical protein